MHKFILIIHSVIILAINIVAKPILAMLMFFHLNVRYKNLRAISSIKGPFLVLPNHTSQWDPFVISYAIPRPIHWVASDAAFRDSLLRWLMILSGVIPKIKEQSDMITLQKVKKAIFMRHAAGIFPEGEQNWDGRSLNLIPATAKLIRFFKVPVLVPLIKGGFLTKPRWAWRIRRCRIEVHFKRIIDGDEIKTMKLAEIEQRLKQNLNHDDYRWQTEQMAPIRSEKRAENMELAHFICPFCEEVGSLISSGNDLSCRCGYTVHVNRYGFLEYPEAGPSFSFPGEWISWQNTFLVDRMKDLIDSVSFGGEADPVLLRDAGITLMRAQRAMPMKAVLVGEARLYKDRIEVGDPVQTMMSFPLRETTAANTFKQQKFEFRYEKSQYRFAMPSRSVSGYKWETAYKGLRQLLVERGEW